MKKSVLLYLNTFLLSAVVLCFEITSTRISSVIFVNDYAFIIVSLALLGLGSGGIFSYYSISAVEAARKIKIISRTLALMGCSLLVFIGSVIVFSLALPVFYFVPVVLLVNGNQSGIGSGNAAVHKKISLPSEGE